MALPFQGKGSMGVALLFQGHGDVAVPLSCQDLEDVAVFALSRSVRCSCHLVL